MALAITSGYTWKVGEEENLNTFPKKLNLMFSGSAISMSAGFLLGSGAVGTSAGEITLGTNLTFSGTTLNAASSGGNVVSSGTPSAGQSAEWVTSTTIQGVTVTGTGNYVKATNPTLAALTNTGLTDISAASAGQISFPATQNPSAGANVLDDYEEGTWTPTLNSFTIVLGAGSVSKTGTYTKIGRLVFLNCRISPAGGATIASVAGTSNVGGLPFSQSTLTSGSFGFDTGTVSGGLSMNFNLMLPGSWPATSQEIGLTASYNT